MTERRSSPWRWPILALGTFILIVAVGVVLASCAARSEQGGGNAPAPAGPVTVPQGDGDGFEERQIILSDGTKVLCLTWSDHNMFDETTSSGLWCKEAKAE